MLIANVEVFALTPYEMPEINPNFIKHDLNFLPLSKLQGRKSTIEHVDAVIEEIEKLKKEASAITEILYPN